MSATSAVQQTDGTWVALVEIDGWNCGNWSAIGAGFPSQNAALVYATDYIAGNRDSN
jgi:hypothetical protein